MWCSLQHVYNLLVAHRHEQPGEVIALFGCMHSGKTEALVEDLRRAQLYAQLQVQAFKPVLDDRGEGLRVIRGKNGSEFPATPIRQVEEVFRELREGVKVVGFDEAQFYSPAIIEIIRILSVDMRIRVIVAGLPTDFTNAPFGPMPGIIAMADTRREFNGICTFRNGDENPCGGKATRTQRLVDGKPAPRNSPQVLVGSQMYEARCPEHHFVPEE